MGYEVIDVLLEKWSPGSGQSAFSAKVWDARADKGDQSAKVVLAKPQTYMNRSGQSVGEMVSFYKADPAQVLVVMDDMELPLGRVRIRGGGSAGGHKGLADVLNAFGANEVPRLRIGIARPPGGWDPVDYVLSRFDEKELEEIGAAIRIAADAAEDWVFGDLTSVMEKYNRKPES